MTINTEILILWVTKTSLVQVQTCLYLAKNCITCISLEAWCQRKVKRLWRCIKTKIFLSTCGSFKETIDKKIRMSRAWGSSSPYHTISISSCLKWIGMTLKEKWETRTNLFDWSLNINPQKVFHCYPWNNQIESRWDSSDGKAGALKFFLKGFWVQILVGEGFFNVGTGHP